MKALAPALALAAVQAINPSPRAVIRDMRALQPAEIAQVLTASRQAIAGKTLRIAYVAGGPGPEVVMDSDGRPAWMRMTSGTDAPSGHVDLITVLHYTHTSARACDGHALDAELVVEFEHRTPPGTWSAKARTRSAMEVAAPIFDTLTGVTTLESGGFRDFDGGRRARAFTASWNPPGRMPSDADTKDPTQSLWIDVESLLPLRWSLAMPARSDMPALPDYGLSFTYDASIDIRAPDGVAVPDCVR